MFKYGFNWVKNLLQSFIIIDRALNRATLVKLLLKNDLNEWDIKLRKETETAMEVSGLNMINETAFHLRGLFEYIGSSKKSMIHVLKNSKNLFHLSFTHINPRVALLK